jgi:hypothetical protein
MSRPYARQFTKTWYEAVELFAEDFHGAACAETHHRSYVEIWTLDYTDKTSMDAASARKLKERAVTICMSECPVLEKCARYALRHPDLVGVWGGMDDERRKAFRKALEGRP